LLAKQLANLADLLRIVASLSPALVIKAGEIQALVGVKHRQTFRENYLIALIGKGWLGRTIPDKPQSRLQRYQPTDEGKKWLQSATNQTQIAQT